MRTMDKKVERIDAELEAKYATMAPEDIAAEERTAHEHLQAMASESGPAKRWFDKK